MPHVDIGVILQENSPFKSLTKEGGNNHAGDPDLQGGGRMPVYGWVILVLVVLALIVAGAIVVQRRRRAGGIISARGRKKGRKR
jgi:hypothetical protein